MRIRYIYACLIALLSHQGLAIEGSGNGENSFTEAEKIFALKVSPVLSGKCHACHGSDPDKIKGGFKTTSRESMMAGGDTRSDILVPGSPDESFLITAVK